MIKKVSAKSPEKKRYACTQNSKFGKQSFSFYTADMISLLLGLISDMWKLSNHFS